MRRETVLTACECAAICLVWGGVATFSLGASMVVAGLLLLMWLVLSVQ